jgi:hypothetical protein
MTISGPFEEDKPELKLQPEVTGGGPGGPPKTAVGAGSHDDEPDSEPFVPTKTPKWFVWVFPVARPFTRCQLEHLTPKHRRHRCENAMLTDDELTVLNMRWLLNLNLDWTISGDSIKHFAPNESDLERQSVWKLWSYNLWRSKTVWRLETALAWCVGLAVIWFLLPPVKNCSPPEGCYYGSWFHLWGEPATLLVLMVLWTTACFWLPASVFAGEIISNRWKQ